MEPKVTIMQAWSIAVLLGIGCTFMLVILPHLRWVSDVSTFSQGAIVAEAAAAVVPSESAGLSVEVSALGGVLPVVRREIPVRLQIPTINVDAPVESIGLTPEGAMDSPKNPENVAWLESGPRPGEAGSAVIAGHFGWKDGKAAVFDNLSKLRKGDVLSVEDASGTVHTFVVRELRSYDKDANASDIFSSEAGKTQLVLITCEGDWNKEEQSYSKRLVVFADKIEQ